MVQYDFEVTGEDIAQELIALRKQIDELEIRFSRLATAFDKANLWAYEGFNTAFDWIRVNCHLNSHQAWNAFAVGTQESELTQSVQAMQSGEIGFAHLATMARTANEVGGAFEETKLLPLA